MQIRTQRSEPKIRSGSESQGRDNGDIKPTLDKVHKRLNILNEKHEKLAMTVTEEVVKSR